MDALRSSGDPTGHSKLLTWNSIVLFGSVRVTLIFA